MAKRKYHRRSDEELIAEYETKIRDLEHRVQAKERPDAVVIKELPKFRRQLAKFSQLCMDNQRPDLSNSILAFMCTFDVQAKDSPG